MIHKQLFSQNNVHLDLLNLKHLDSRYERKQSSIVPLNLILPIETMIHDFEKKFDYQKAVKFFSRRTGALQISFVRFGKKHESVKYVILIIDMNT